MRLTTVHRAAGVHTALLSPASGSHVCFFALLPELDAEKG
jgi:hypothetical protein